MYLVCEGFSMLELYRRYGWMNHEYEFPTAFHANSLTPKTLRAIILRCVAPSPSDRPTLEQLARLLHRLVDAKENHGRKDGDGL